MRVLYGGLGELDRLDRIEDAAAFEFLNNNVTVLGILSRDDRGENASFNVRL